MLLCACGASAAGHALSSAAALLSEGGGRPLHCIPVLKHRATSDSTQPQRRAVRTSWKAARNRPPMGMAGLGAPGPPTPGNLRSALYQMTSLDKVRPVRGQGEGGRVSAVGRRTTVLAWQDQWCAAASSAVWLSYPWRTAHVYTRRGSTPLTPAGISLTWQCSSQSHRLRSAS